MFRKTILADIPQILMILDEAKQALKIAGIDQWQNGYPNKESIQQDIEQGISYVYLDVDNNIVGTLALSFAGEPTYQTIYQGNWLSAQPYGVIHRIATKQTKKNQGIASAMLTACQNLARQKAIYSLRIDTHEDNKAMQRLLEKNSFAHCGTILLTDGAERIAFEKIYN